MPADTLRVHLLGSFRLLHRDEAVTGFDQTRLQELLAYLLLHRNVPIPRQQLAFLFWPDSVEEQARTNFRNLWHRLRRALPDADRLLLTDDLSVQWRGDPSCWLDVAAFETGLQRARADLAPDAQIANLNEAMAVYGGELLPGCYSDWLLAERDRLARAYGAALEQLAALFEERRDYRQAIGHAQTLLRHDPLHEPAYAGLMRLHALNDDRAAALHTYHTCATVLRRELDVTPGPATRELYERLLNVMPQPAAPMQTEAAILLVGREAEWTQLQQAWRAAAGRARLTLISGEAGIGKTRLAEALAEWVGRQGIPALTARCYAASGDLAYAPVVTWLRGHPLAPLADPWLRELARLLPEIGAERPDLPPVEPLTEQWQRLRLFEALRHAVLAGHTALLLTLDDLQWCDRDTLDWLHYLLAARPDPRARMQLLVVATLRSEESEAGSALAGWLAAWRAELARAGQLTEIELGPLSQDASLNLADRVAGQPFDRALGPLLYEGTEGHPLFIVEMVRAGFAQNAPAPARHATAMMEAPAALPARVRQVLEARLAQLSSPARGVIELAAVVGRAFTYGVVAHATDLSEDLLVGSLDECWRKRIIREQGEDSYDFSHDKLREAAYAGLSRTRRRWLHGRVAQALETLHAEELDTVSGQIAAHYEQAGKPQPAIDFYRRAAGVAQGIYANTEAIRLYQHLLEGGLGKSLSANETCALLLALGEVWRVNGQWADAQAINQKAIHAAEKTGDVTLLAQAQRALADMLRLQGHYDTALDWLARAKAGFESIGKWRGVVSALWTMSEIHWFKGDNPQALVTLEQQLRIATEIHDQRGICEALDTLGMVYWSQGDWDRSIDCCLQAIAIAEPLGYHLVITRAAITLGNVGSSRHRASEAIHWWLRAGVLARQIDDHQVMAWAIANIAGFLGMRGNFLTAVSGIEQALQVCLEIGDRWTACLNIATLGINLEGLGAVEQAESSYQKAIEYGRRLGIPSYLAGMLIDLACLLIAQGRATEAHGLYAEAEKMMADVKGERLAGEDTRFKARVLGPRLHYALGQLTQAEAVAQYRAMRDTATSLAQHATLLYELWQLVPDDQEARTTAAALYRSQYAETDLVEHRQRYLELTGETLPDPPSLPDVSELVPVRSVDLTGLAERLKPILVWLDASFS